MTVIRRSWRYVLDVAASTKQLKGAIVLAFAFGAGLAIFGLGGKALLQWWADRPRPWTVGPVTAQFEDVATDSGAQNLLVFVYALQNNTSRDLYLASGDMRVAARFAPHNTFLSLNAIEALALDSPIFVPAKQRALFRLITYWPYDGSTPLPAGGGLAERQARGALLRRYLRNETAIAGFVLFHQPTRYQIELPKGWDK